MNFFILLSIPLILIVFNFLIFKRKVTFKELLFQVTVQIVIVIASIFILYNMNVKDTEIRSGSVIEKSRDRVSCQHSYSCNCVESCSGTGANRSCTDICQTCYDHSYDIDWNILTTIGNITINRVDRQGLSEPSRWSRVYKGEPVALSFSYDNYIKGARETLFKNKSLLKKYKNKIPKYPSHIYDYYNIKRFVQIGTDIKNKKEINKKLMKVNADNGSLKEVNIVLVTTNEENEELGYAIEQSWIGGKKNDVITILGLKDNKEIKWIKILDWSQTTLLKYTLKEELLEMKEFDHNKIIDSIEKNIVKYFKRKPMKDFEYLKSRVKPSNNQLMLALLIGILISLITGFITHRARMFE